MFKDIFHSVKTNGWNEKRLFDTPKFIELIRAEGINFFYEKVDCNTFEDACIAALEQGMSKEKLSSLKKKSQKKLFKTNLLWKILNRKYQIDLVIPFLTGHWTLKPIICNTITTKGKEITAKQLGGTTTVPVTAIALGIGTGGTTALNSEITTAGGVRGAATVTNTTTDTTGDTEQWVKTFTFTGTFAITEEGLFDNNTSGGNMLAYQTFSAINVVDTDTLQITHKVKIA